jgi:hypothetical protein
MITLVENMPRISYDYEVKVTEVYIQYCTVHSSCPHVEGKREGQSI